MNNVLGTSRAEPDDAARANEYWRNYQRTERLRKLLGSGWTYGCLESSGSEAILTLRDRVSFEQGTRVGEHQARFVLEKTNGRGGFMFISPPRSTPEFARIPPAEYVVTADLDCANPAHVLLQKIWIPQGLPVRVTRHVSGSRIITNLTDPATSLQVSCGEDLHFHRVEPIESSSRSLFRKATPGEAWTNHSQRAERHVLTRH